MSEYDDLNVESNGGRGFMIGLVTGAVLGAGLGLLFAPKSGAEMRTRLTKRATDFADTASQAYRQAADKTADMAATVTDRGRDLYDRSRDAVSRTADDAERYAKDVAGSMADTRRG